MNVHFSTNISCNKLFDPKKHLIYSVECQIYSNVDYPDRSSIKGYFLSSSNNNQTVSRAS